MRIICGEFPCGFQKYSEKAKDKKDLFFERAYFLPALFDMSLTRIGDHKIKN